MKHFIAGLFIVSFSFTLTAQVVLFEEDFSTGLPATWTTVNADGLTPDTAVSEFTSAWIAYTTEMDTAVASTSFYDPVGQASDYLITPRLAIGTFSKIVWSARSVDASYPDGYTVLISNTDSLVDSFTDTLYTNGAENAVWQRRSADLDAKGFANEDVFIAFKNNTTDGFILMLDDVVLLSSEFANLPKIDNTVTAGPNPATDFIRINATGFVQVTVYTLDGRLQLSSAQQQLNVQPLTPGVYLALVETQTGLERIQFVKQ